VVEFSIFMNSLAFFLSVEEPPDYCRKTVLKQIDAQREHDENAWKDQFAGTVAGTSFLKIQMIAIPAKASWRLISLAFPLYV